jgi:hypothetical protein
MEFKSAIGDALSSKHTIMVSDDLLRYLEEKWTTYRRVPEENISASSSRQALMVYYTHISERWQPRRVIAFIIFDDNVTRMMEVDTPPGTPQPAARQARSADVTHRDVVSLVECLKRQSTDDNLLTAIETRSVFLVKDKTSAVGFVPKNASVSEIPAFFQVLQYVALENPRSFIEPITRFSSTVEYQRISATENPRTFISPYEDKPFSTARRGRMKSVLVYSNGIREAKKHGGPAWCLYCRESYDDVPDTVAQFDRLINFWESDRFYATTYFLSQKKIRHPLGELPLSAGKAASELMKP